MTQKTIQSRASILQYNYRFVMGALDATSDFTSLFEDNSMIFLLTSAMRTLCSTDVCVTQSQFSRFSKQYA